MGFPIRKSFWNGACKNKYDNRWNRATPKGRVAHQGTSLIKRRNYVGDTEETGQHPQVRGYGHGRT